MLTGILSLAVGYLGAEGAVFTVGKLFVKPAGKLTVEAHKSGEVHRDLYWALERVDRKTLTKKDKSKFDKMFSAYTSDASNINLRSGT